MLLKKLGWDIDGPTYAEKNGGLDQGAGCPNKPCRKISTTAAVFGPVTGPKFVGVLFMNSDVSGGPAAGLNAQQVLKKAVDAAIK